MTKRNRETFRIRCFITWDYMKIVQNNILNNNLRAISKETLPPGHLTLCD